jgi:hypothetical protein
LDEFSPIGRLFTLGSGLKITGVARKGYIFPCISFDKNDWAINWATFSLTHLVTLVLSMRYSQLTSYLLFKILFSR